jgi:hypothetical protein
LTALASGSAALLGTLGAGACSSFDASPTDGTDGGDPLADGTTTDGALDADAAAILPPVDAGPCNLAEKWGGPTYVADISSGADELGAWPVGNDVFFSRGDPYKIYRGRIVAGAFEKKPLVFGVASLTQKNPSFDDTGLWLAHETNPEGPQRIYLAKRTDSESTDFYAIDNPLRTGMGLSVVETAGHFGAGAVWFGSAPSATGDFDLYRAAFDATDGGVGQALPLAAVNKVGTNENYPVVTADGLRIYFASDRDKATMNTGYDVFTATRADKDAAFGAPVSVPELATAFDELPSWISPDGCQMLLLRTRDDGTHDVYRVAKPH